MHFRYWYIPLLAAGVFGFSSLQAQNLMGGQISPQEKEAFKKRVKGIEQFMKRFNHEEDLTGKPTQAQTLDTAFLEGRKRSITYLLDYKKYGQANQEEAGRVRKFIDYVNKGDSTAWFLDFYDQGWYAQVTMEAKHQGKPIDLALTLKNEVVGDKKSKWVVTGVVSEALKLENQDPSAFLPPNASGTNFIALGDALEAPENAPAYTSEGFQADPLTMFFTHLQVGTLEVGRVKQVSFHFLQFPGWGMVVEEFNRIEGANSGWLISDVFPLLNRDRYRARQLGMSTKQ